MKTLNEEQIKIRALMEEQNARARVELLLKNVPTAEELIREQEKEYRESKI